jgi:hypothetical protein
LAPNGIGGATYGAAIHWRTPLPGLMIGASDGKDPMWSGKITAGNGALTGTESIAPFNDPNYFALYEKNKVMVAAEYGRLPVSVTLQFTGLPPSYQRIDFQSWYAMASYKLTSKITAGVYDSQQVNHQAPLGPARYSKDWTISGRYDFSQYLYAKAEEHIIDGTAIGYDTDLNPNGLKPNTKLTILKVGVSF